MPLFLDACALAKRYVNEGRSTQTMKEITGRPTTKWGGLIVSRWVEIETISAIANYIRRSPHHTQAEAFARFPQTVAMLRKDLASGAFDVIEVADEITASAMHLLIDHPKQEIGAGDAIHLATALGVKKRLPNLIFVTADGPLYRAAQGRGLQAFDPNYGDMYALINRVNSLLQ